MKKILIILIIIAVAGLSIYVITKKDKDNNSSVSSGDKQTINVSLLDANESKAFQFKTSLEGKESVSNDGTGLVHNFNSKNSIDEMISSNKDSFVGKVFEGTDKEKALFFKDNNYYVLEKVSEEGSNEPYYKLRNAAGSASYNSIDSYWFPMPVGLTLDADIYALYLETKKDYSKTLFDFSFEELVKFYQRLDKKDCSIDTENQVIKCSGYNIRENCKKMKDFLTIDYKNKLLKTKVEKGVKFQYVVSHEGDGKTDEIKVKGKHMCWELEKFYDI
ncbi:MAG: hypothetical protein K6G63_06555 [Eubacterium sp.]|nr:hypothetical protein [Eubacterium sp.]